MPTKNEEKEPRQPTVITQLSQSFWTILYMIIYVALGLTLCYLKIIFGDMCRAPNLNHSTFTDPNTPYPVDKQETTPSVPYYCKEDSHYYVKHLFIAEPNFITAYAQFRGKKEKGKVIPPTYTENESSQIFKSFFLETSYILFSVTSVLQSIPDWLIILLHPFIWMFTFFGMSIFTWLISSYNIFMYFLNPKGVFAQWYVGWLSGFIAWFVFMCLWGAFTVPIGVMSGFGQLLVLLSKQQVRVLDPSVVEGGGGILQNPPNESQYKHYSFSQYFLDMVKTSPIIHLMILYTSYSIVAKMTQTISVSFSKIFTYAFLAVIVLVLLWHKGRFTFIPQNKLNETGWTSHVEPVLFPEMIQVVAGVVLPSSLKNVLDQAQKNLGINPTEKLNELTTGAKSAMNSLMNNLSTPAESPVESPVPTTTSSTTSSTPSETPGETPAPSTTSFTPAESPAETPAPTTTSSTPSESPAESPAPSTTSFTPSESPGEPPAESPVPHTP